MRRLLTAWAVDIRIYSITRLLSSAYGGRILGSVAIQVV